MIPWILSAVSILGAILNTRKRVEGFYVWNIGNIGWILYIVLTAQKDLYGQILLWLAYIGVCCYGIYNWTWGGKENENKKRN